MRPGISEFSYGFAITSEFVQSPGAVTAAPEFPSLRAEGQRGGGWDVRLDRPGVPGAPGVPLFLQFKLCDRMTRRTCREAQQEGFNVPCYRMHLRPARFSRQHEMLLDLEADTDEAVFYVAPMFHQPEELNDAFLRGAVRARSIWLPPSDIGPLPDDRDHHVSFEPGSPWMRFSEPNQIEAPSTLASSTTTAGRWMRFSEPKQIEAKREFEDVEKHLTDRLREHGRTALSAERLEKLADVIARIADKRHDIGQRERDASKAAARLAAPLQRVAYYASVFLESQLFVVRERQTP